jgi:pimeloyl-ACP methyl ester carboxylesterase
MASGRSSTALLDEELSAFRFITVDGIRLRCLDRGCGTAVLLLHGNGSMIEDFIASGIMDDADTGHRFIAFDRPGFGFSERPPGRRWGPREQANLLLRAARQLDIERPIVVGHSWGALVALAMALERAEDVGGLVLISGHYYPMEPAGTLPAAFPFGIFVRRMMAADTVRRVFAPCIVSERFKRTFPLALAMRLSQMQTVDEEAAMLFEAVNGLCRHYRELRVPVHLIAGSEDGIVDTEQHSTRLHEEIATSTYHRVPGCGHMVHHTAPAEVMAAIATIGLARTREQTAMVPNRPLRQWLHIGEEVVAA